jgi:putative transposase
MDNLKYKNKYRIPTTRLKNYDYAQNGYYFVTICTKNKQHYFGKIENEQMILNKIGEIVLNELKNTEIIRKNIKLDEFIIMPNHIHGIIIINSVETHCNASLQFSNKFGPQINNLASIIRGFKGTTTKQINNMQNEKFFQWQARFYDRIIRNEKELFNIRQYIVNNPIKWQYDEYY